MAKGTRKQPGRGRESRSEDLDALFRHASSRPRPPQEHTREVRQALHGEWLAVTARRRRRRLAAGFSIAAAVVLAVTLVVLQSGDRSPAPQLREVARVDRISGHVRVVAVASAGSGAPLAREMPVYIGQTVRTSSASGIALRLDNGIALRVDENTEVGLTEVESVELRSGRIYVDTSSGAPFGGDAPSKSRFQVLTAKGTVRHVGTQYMVRLADQRLNVSVRKGRVQVLTGRDTDIAPVHVSYGQALSLVEPGDHELVAQKGYGEQWDWAEELGPGFVLEGRTMTEFLDWVGSETGLEIEYTSPSARALAEETVLHGQVDLPARKALDLILMTSDLTAEVGDGVIRIGEKP